MLTMGCVISHKNGERRRGLLPSDLARIRNLDSLKFERGYGESLGISDEEYLSQGVCMGSRDEVLACDIIMDVKLGDADYLDDLDAGKILFGWAHAVQNVSFTSAMLSGSHTVIAWEEIFEDGRYIFYRNREIAGEAGVLQAFRYSGRMPYDAKVAVVGNGQTAKGALRVLHGLGAEVDVYGRKFEELFKKNMVNYDVIVNCVMWDTDRTDRLIYRDDLKRLKKGALIIDISCDPYLEIETSHPTTIDDPVYEVDNVIHYAVDNTPAMYPVTVSKTLSKGIACYIDPLIEDWYPDSLEKAMVIQKGHIRDERIRRFRESRGLYCE